MHANVHAIHRPPSPTLVGASRPMVELRARIERIGASDVPVLVRGETGVGKELTASALHAASNRAIGPFVPVNCGALPRDLVEAELFGAEPGAFTGARRRPGLVAAAHHGTLFLDEIGDLPLPAQAALLRVLETGQVCAVGDHRPKRIDFRLVSATHRDLASMVERGHFRLDLYQRLAGIVIRVPPLRERSDDLIDLASTLCGSAVARLTPDAWNALRAYAWPGNVRELHNVLRAALVCTDGLIRASDLELRPLVPKRALAEVLPLKLNTARYITQIYTQFEGNARATARALQISPGTVHKHLALALELAL